MRTCIDECHRTPACRGHASCQTYKIKHTHTHTKIHECVRKHTHKHTHAHKPRTKRSVHANINCKTCSSLNNNTQTRARGLVHTHVQGHTDMCTRTRAHAYCYLSTFDSVWQQSSLSLTPPNLTASKRSAVIGGGGEGGEGGEGGGEKGGEPIQSHGNT